MRDNKKYFTPQPDQEVSDDFCGMLDLGLGFLYGIIMSVVECAMLVFYVLKVLFNIAWIDIGAPIFAGMVLLYLVADIVVSVIKAIRLKDGESWGILAFNSIYWLSYIWLPIVLLIADFLFWIF